VQIETLPATTLVEPVKIVGEEFISAVPAIYRLASKVAILNLGEEVRLRERVPDSTWQRPASLEAQPVSAQQP